MLLWLLVYCLGYAAFGHTIPSQGAIFRGPPGAPGQSGQDGKIGRTGITGIRGKTVNPNIENEIPGSVGITGNPGSIHAETCEGQQGAVGPVGATGAAGASLTGMTGATGATGQPGLSITGNTGEPGKNHLALSASEVPYNIDCAVTSGILCRPAKMHVIYTLGPSPETIIADKGAMIRFFFVPQTLENGLTLLLCKGILWNPATDQNMPLRTFRCSQHPPLITISMSIFPPKNGSSVFLSYSMTYMYTSSIKS